MSAGKYWKEFKELINNSFDLRSGLDRWGSIESIRTNIDLKGYNTWLLICGIFIASIGLDTNSPAVIIGAMLISPLMSPILGMGLAVGINDRRMLYRSLVNFGIAVVVGLLVSIIYYSITPLGELTSEMESRTRPTLLDVGVAFFGGIAGIVAGSRKEKLNAIPGVAIATALLPPLSVAGFGIATMNWRIFSGAFYLFFINTVFVSFATYMVVRILGYPYKEFKSKKNEWLGNALFLLFLAIVVIPSAVVLTNLISEQAENRRISRFINDEMNNASNQTLKWSVATADSISELKIFTVGKYIDADEQALLSKKLEEYQIADKQITLVQMEQPPADYDQLSNNIQNDILQTIEVNQQQKAAQEAEREALLNDALLSQSRAKEMNKIEKELLSLFNEVESCWIDETYLAEEDSSKVNVDREDIILPSKHLFIKSKNGKSLLPEKKNRIEQWLEVRLDGQAVEVHEIK